MVFNDICSTEKHYLAMFRISQLFSQLEWAVRGVWRNQKYDKYILPSDESKMAFPGKKPGIQRKRIASWRLCLSRSISAGTFLWIRMMGRRRFVSIYSTSTSSFLRSGSQNGFVACMRFALNNSAAKSRFLTLYTLYRGCFLNWTESVVYILLW